VGYLSVDWIVIPCHISHMLVMVALVESNYGSLIVKVYLDDW